MAIGSKRKIRLILTILLSATITAAATPDLIAPVAAQSYFGGITIGGLVNNPFNLSDADLLAMPMVSETVTLECVWGFPADVTFNWTGIPIFHLLTLAEIKPEAYKIVFRARLPDSFSSALKIEDAFKPSTILAVMVNGTPVVELPELAPDHIGGYRIVVPGKWGYKWVANVGNVEIVDYDYLGTYERPTSEGGLGESDEADIPGAVSPTVDPPLETFSLQFGNRTFQINIFTNNAITDFSFDHATRTVSFTVTPTTRGFANAIIPQTLLRGPYTVFVNDIAANFSEANATGQTYINVNYSAGSHSLKIIGTEYLGPVPTAVIKPFSETALIGRPVFFNASSSIDDGAITSYEWNFGDGTNAAGSTVTHSYVNTGTYQVVLNVTDNDGLSNQASVNVVVITAPLIDFVTLLRVGIGLALIGFVVVFLVLYLSKKPGKNLQRLTHRVVKASFCICGILKCTPTLERCRGLIE